MATPTLVQNLQNAQAQYVRNQRERQKQLASIRHDIKKTAIFVFIAAVIVAALADILSLFDVGWIVSWAIPFICWVMVRRITRINKTGDRIAAADVAAQRQLQILRQRLRPALQATGNAQLLTESRLGNVAWKTRSYISIFVRDTAITQLVELVPFLDWLPFYIGQVVKVFIDQNIEYQKVRKFLPQLERTFSKLERLEKFEIIYIARVLALSIRANTSGQRRNAAPQQQPQPQAIPTMNPQFAT